jgi:hypothetical protein
MDAMENKKRHDEDKEPKWLEVVRKQVESLRFGVVQIIVHDGQVTRIERTERMRLE